MAQALNIASRKVGGMRIIKIGRLTLSFSVSREFRPFAKEAKPRKRRITERMLLQAWEQGVMTGMRLAKRARG